MNKTIKKIFKSLKNFLFAFYKLGKMESSIRTQLTNDYLLILAMPRPLKRDLDNLYKLVLFCERHGINGKTNKIQLEIKALWSQRNA